MLIKQNNLQLLKYGYVYDQYNQVQERTGEGDTGHPMSKTAQSLARRDWWKPLGKEWGSAPAGSGLVGAGFTGRALPSPPPGGDKAQLPVTAHP